jgi:flagellar biosynthesis/type III secretory pathway M-ring protein FliF/YscJ
MFERLRQLVHTVQTQLGLLTVSQRVAIGLCAAIVVGSLMWLMQWTTAPELVPLVGHDFTYEELNAAEEALRAAGVTHRVQGMRLYVREPDHANVKRILYSAQALPQERLFDMEAVIKDPNPFQSPEARSYAQNYAKGNELAKIIATYPAVRKASVLINPSSKRRLGGESDVPTASVVVGLAPGRDLTPEMVEGFAKLVSGAVAGLKPHNVNVSNAGTGETFNVPRPEDAVTFDYLRVVQKHEAHLQQKILRKLADIPGVRVAVTVELDASKKVRQSTKYEPAQVKSEVAQTSEQGSTEEPAESGTQANIGTAIASGGGNSKSATEETTTDYYEPRLSETETIEQPPFMFKRATATVGLPRSFLVGVFKAKYPDSAPPKEDDSQFTALRDEEVARVKASVERIVMAKAPADVQVDVYPDMTWSEKGGAWSEAPVEAQVAAQGAAESMDPMSMARTYGPQVGLALLALTSLMMMMKVARKSTQELTSVIPKEDLPPPEEPILTVDAHPVGQVEVSESLLTGREIDDLTLRYEEIAGEVSKMVEADPAGAADLIRRWAQEVK